MKSGSFPPTASPRDASAGSPSSQWFTAGRFAGGLAVLLGIAFPAVLLGTRSFVYRDYGVLGYPFVFHFHESFWRGELPLWNPLSNCGAPFMAQWGTMVFYPFSLIHLLLPLPWSLGFFSLAHLFLGGLGTYFLARRWTGNPFAASVAGLACVFNGVAFSSLAWPNYMVALGWMPWVIHVAEQSFEKGGKHMLAAGVLAALQLLVGTPEIVLLTWLVIGALLIRHWMRHPESRRRALIRCGVAVLVAAGLAAIQILPFLDLLVHSQRDAGYSSSKWPMPGWGWANLLVPLFRCFETPQGPFFQYGQQFMSSYYLGAGLLVLALWVSATRRDSRVWILCAAFFFAIIMALGENGFLFTWFKELVPISSVARYPVKFMTLAGFVLPLLAAYAVAHLDSAAPTRQKLLLILSGTALLLMALIVAFAYAYPFSTDYDQPDVTLRNAMVRGVFLALMIGALLFLCRATSHARLWRAAVLLLIPLDVLTHTANQNPTLPSSVFDPGLWEAENNAPPPHLGQGRVFITPQAEEQLLRSSVPELELDFIGKRLALWSNLNLLEQTPKINGSSTLQLGPQAAVQKRLYEQTNSAPEGLLRFLGASYQSSASSAIEWVARPAPLPMITAGQRPRFADATHTLDALVGPEFDPATTVYLPPEAEATVSVTSTTACQVLDPTFAFQRLTAGIEAAETSLVVIAQSFYHPWRATVDGRPVQLWRANHAFQALQVPPGRHQIELHYADRNFHVGASISGGTVLVCLASLLALRRRRPKSSGNESSNP